MTFIVEAAFALGSVDLTATTPHGSATTTKAPSDGWACRIAQVQRLSYPELYGDRAGFPWSSEDRRAYAQALAALSWSDVEAEMGPFA